MTEKEQDKIDYIKEGERRMKLRKQKRFQKYVKKIEQKKNKCTCGEDPYCYCGSGTPGVIDY